MIAVESLSKRFVIQRLKATELKERVVSLLKGRRTESEEIWALRDVTFGIGAGEAVALIGANGSGKSTLLQCMARILVPDAGSVRVSGRVAPLLELGAGFNPDLTGRENVYLASAIQGLSRRQMDDRMEEVVAFAELERFIDTPVKSYSTGMYLRLAFSVATHVDADVLLIDEILAVGDEAFQAKCLRRIEEFRQRGATIVLVSHSMAAVRRICDRAMLLHEGRLVLDAMADEVVQHYLSTIVADRMPPAARALPEVAQPASLRAEPPPPAPAASGVDGPRIPCHYSSRPFDPAPRALASPGFRVAGVHFWQDGWSGTFWTDVKVDRLDADLERLQELHFNAIVLTVPWGVFQPAAFPPSYDEAAFALLHAILERARRFRTYVILRVGTGERKPEGIEGTRFFMPDLSLSERELSAYTELFGEVAHRVKHHDHVLFLLHSWEDLTSYRGYFARDEACRREAARRTASFRDHLQKRSLEEWNAAWATRYGSWDEVPIPGVGDAAYGEISRFHEERVRGRILPGIVRAVKGAWPAGRLAFEVPLPGNDAGTGGGGGLDVHATWRLPSGYDYVAAAATPARGAPDDGRRVAPADVVQNVRRLLADLRAISGRRPFVSQLHVTDPRGSAGTSPFVDEGEIQARLEAALPVLYEGSLGYAFWSLEPYEVNLLENASFELGTTAAWELDGIHPQVHHDPLRGQKFARLPSGASVRQEVHAEWNPGCAHPHVPLTLRVLTRVDAPTVLDLRYEVAQPSGHWGHVLDVRLPLFPPGWGTSLAALPFAGHFRITFRAGAGGAVDLDEVSIWSHREAAAALEPASTAASRRREILARHHRAWHYGWDQA